METGETLKVHFREVTDKKLVAKYDKVKLFVPPDESPDTLDQAIMESQAYAETAKERGQHRPIEVAVNENDPNIDSKDSSQRFHLRIINGKHRYAQDPNWKRKYYHIDTIFEYFEARKIFDFQKVTTTKEKKVLIKQIAKALIRTEGIKPHECCDEIIKRDLTRWSGTTVRKYCPARFKMLNMAVRKSDEELGKKTKLDRIVKEDVKKILLEKDEEIKRLQEQLEDKTRELGTVYDAKRTAEEEAARSKDVLSSFTQGPMEAEVSGTNGFKVKIWMDLRNKRYIIEKV